VSGITYGCPIIRDSSSPGTLMWGIAGATSLMNGLSSLV
jgi:hypothetical protein